MHFIVMLLLFLTASETAADDSRFSAHLFAKFQVKGCTTCHDYFDKERNGIAFRGHGGRSPDMCKSCHPRSVTGFDHEDEWFAMSGLYMSGMTASQTCESTMQAVHAGFKSRSLLKREMEKHLFEDPRVLWAIEGATPQSGQLPGGKREGDLVKGGLQLWKKQVQAWIDGGMKCD